MNLIETALGYEAHFPWGIVLFGAKNSNSAELKKYFPNFQFCRINQTHGDQIVQRDFENLLETPSADSRWSIKRNVALCISTADCVPAFIYDEKNKVIAGIHAGWRGVANRIIPKTIDLLHQNFKQAHFYFIMGPHIQMNSFEVDNDVKNQLLNSVAEKDSSFFKQTSENKYLVDLNQLVRAQVHEFDISSDCFFDLHIDTKTDGRFHSHRRDKEHAGRQLSFIIQE